MPLDTTPDVLQAKAGSIDVSTTSDMAFAKWTKWHRARHASLLLCRVQQRLESRMLVNPGIPALTTHRKKGWRCRDSERTLPDADVYAIAREAEIFAMTGALKLQDAIPGIAATLLAGVVAKLEMIVAADRDIGDPTDFPWPHIASVLRDLKALAGELPAYRPDRAATRADVSRHWEAAVRLVAALNEEDVRERRKLAV